MTEELSKVEGSTYDHALDAVEFSNILLGLQKALAHWTVVGSNAHNYKVGDSLLLKELNVNYLEEPNNVFTGRELLCRVTFAQVFKGEVRILNILSLEVVEGKNV